MCFFKSKNYGWNTTHNTGFRYFWNSDKKENNQFRIPLTHLMWEKLGGTPTTSPTTSTNANINIKFS